MKGKPTALELKVLHRLWDLGNTATVNEIIADWPDKKVPGYTTVLKVLQIMEEKGYVTHRRAGRSYRYTAVLKKEEQSRGRLTELLQSFFKGDPVRLMNALIAEQDLSPKEIREMRRALEMWEKQRPL
jgi:predicted transcriptional regulator